ncbi:MAG: AAA family ATPase [bacterium]|uniref:ATPase family associated with various cellular activities (AAA) n=1 Tax=Gimesia chilikensis TaxID=2605989 RepID=A0A517PHC1_9PLAN|nr:AAA family ATPase [Gimesia chilikensis]KAA0138320.1 AAA family ATPase [Gimesia chilikensis]MCR9230671.1 AAA family ATPase [bacterium]QDT18764.1 ATPase family associated with various cellular activities (AAA) [Gimesia chilikensis]
MYQSYWNLQSGPFEEKMDAGYFYESHPHQAGLLKLQYLVENRKGAGLLVGNPGSGKSYLCHVLKSQLAERHQPFVQLVFPQLSPVELISYLAVELGAEEAGIEPGVTGKDRIIRALHRQLQLLCDQGAQPVIVIDEAHLIADQRIFETLHQLLNFQQTSDVDFTLLLVGDRLLLSHLQRSAQLDDRISVRCLLRPFSAEETQRYVEHRLQVAGRTEPVFEASAFQTLFELTQGNPRKINRLCDLGLLVGYADELPLITSDVLEAVSEELVTSIPD